MQKINRELERLRGLAIILVVLAHAPLAGMMPEWYGGKSGVDLFFVVSGFVVFLSLSRKLAAGRAGVRDFYIRRVCRIVPLAIVGALLALVGATFFNQQGNWSPVSVVGMEIFQIFTLTYNYFAAHGSGHDLVHYWSLNVEEHFYLLLPLFLFAVQQFRFRVGLLLAWIALSSFVIRPFAGTTWWSVWDFDPTKLITYGSHCRFDGLALGVLLGLCFTGGYWPVASDEPVERFISRALGWAAVSVLAAIGPAYYNLSGVPVVTGAAGILVFLATFERGYVLPLWKISRLLEHVGARSYTLYILHPVTWFFFANWLRIPVRGLQALSPAVQISSIAAYLGCTFLVVELSYRLLERPCIAWGRSWSLKAQFAKS